MSLRSTVVLFAVVPVYIFCLLQIYRFAFSTRRGTKTSAPLVYLPRSSERQQVLKKRIHSEIYGMSGVEDIANINDDDKGPEEVQLTAVERIRIIENVTNWSNLSEDEVAAAFYNARTDSVCPYNKWHRYPNGATTPEDETIVLTQEQKEHYNKSINVYVRMGKYRSAVWLHETLPRFGNCQYINKVIIDWWPQTPFPSEYYPYLRQSFETPPADPFEHELPVNARGQKFYIKDFGSRYTVRIEFVESGTDITDRYDFKDELDTPYTIFLDDDRGFTCKEALELAHISQNNPNLIVGSVLRTMFQCAETQVFRYQDAFEHSSTHIPADYATFVLPGHSLIPTSFFGVMRKHVPENILKFSSKYLHCDDILFEFAIAQERASMGLPTHVGVVANQVAGKMQRESFVRKKSVAIDNPRNRAASRKVRSACLQMIMEAVPNSKPIDFVKKRVSVLAM